MTITIKYFGSLVDITKKKEEQIVLENDKISVAFLKSKIEVAYEGMQNVTYSIAVNQSLSGLDVTIMNQDEIAFLPPFAGG
ncbi:MULTISPECIES: MoaD/ThiS family protein [unclassified Flavobacterium]|jgi:molybdopterin synthase sulfur carrier subunit|uniref:MoaD/ThiS family protein n=1 Tax=unclassified Flavobacterium TaxID=196869 RepID=UPI0025C0AAD2|nr:MULTISPECIES: MoaD/ThiS family protein [unclassified Flavobacterium]